MNKRILVLKDLTIPYTSGSGINVFYFAKHMQHRGYRSTLFTYNWKLKLKTYERIEGIPLMRFPMSRNKILKAFFMVYACIALLAMVPFYKNIVINGIAPGYLWLIWVAKLFNRNCVFESTTLHVDDIQAIVNRKSRGKNLRWHSMRALNAYHSLNPEFTRIFHEQNQDSTIPVLECGQGIDTNTFRPVSSREKERIRQKLKVPCHTPMLLSVGNLSLRKGYAETFEVLSQIATEFVYYIIGESGTSETCFWNNSQESSKLIESAKKRLGNRVVFLGKKTHVSEYLQAADMYLLNSSYEGLPISLMEAMACGITPVVRELNGVNHYLVNHLENSLVHTDAIQFRDNIETLLRHKSTNNELSIKAYETIQNRFSYKVIIPKIIDSLLE